MSVNGMNFLYAVGAVVVLYVAYRLFDLLSPKLELTAEIRRGNIAAAIVVAGLFVAIAIIFAGALT